ncbi:MAG: LysE family translocator [Candidatus Bathyarchaeota archaeon]|nr:LysE family translocator [Candidatus Bathyarchaeota archaeon]MDH5595229.1 LysE family translocator [Candidatus Bathyarchaeota archaeon]
MNPHALICMVNAFESLFPGIILGLVAGLSPGPMLALVIAETLKFGKEEGFKVAVSPLITDSTIVLLTLLALSTLAEHALVIGLISIFGACYLIHIGLENLRTKTSRFEIVIERKETFKRAIITNLLNPHTYLFWLSVGSPIILETLKTDASATIFFLLGFYAFLMGSMTFVALVVDRSKSFIKSKYYSYVVRLLGIILIFFALTVLIEGLKLLALL